MKKDLLDLFVPDCPLETMMGMLHERKYVRNQEQPFSDWGLLSRKNEHLLRTVYVSSGCEVIVRDSFDERETVSFLEGYLTRETDLNEALAAREHNKNLLLKSIGGTAGIGCIGAVEPFIPGIGPVGFLTGALLGIVPAALYYHKNKASSKQSVIQAQAALESYLDSPNIFPGYDGWTRAVVDRF